MKNTIENLEVADALVSACKQTARQVRSARRHDPVLPVMIGSAKKATTLDVGAAATFRKAFRSFGGGRLANAAIVDEETAANDPTDLAKAEIAVNLDPVDGTTNLLRLGHWWCVAATAFAPLNSPGKRILATAVVFEDMRAIFWTPDYPKPIMIEGRKQYPVAGPSGRTTLDGAALAFVGQSPAANQRGNQMIQRLGGAALRIWSIAGIPALPAVVDVGQGGDGLDIILEPEPGQVAHDVSPLLIMAKAAGATVLHLDGRPVDLIHVENLLLNPVANRIAYILAASESLAHSVAASLVGLEAVA